MIGEARDNARSSPPRSLTNCLWLRLSVRVLCVLSLVPSTYSQLQQRVPVRFVVPTEVIDEVGRGQSDVAAVVELDNGDDVLFNAGAASMVAAKEATWELAHSQWWPVRTGHSVPSRRRVEMSKPRTPNRSAPLRMRRSQRRVGDSKLMSLMGHGPPSAASLRSAATKVGGPGSRGQERREAGG